jgi:hypothetical protein
VRLTRSGGASADAVVVLGTFLVLGLVCGVAWWLLVDLPEFSRAESGAAAMGELELGKRFNADGWYAVLAIVSGFAAGVGLTWRRSRDYLWTTLLLLPGAALAAASMAVVGGLLGPSGPAPGVELTRGATVATALSVDAFVVYLMWPVAALAGALMVRWSSTHQPDDAGEEHTDEDLPAGRTTTG